jgi:hypothetical protein
VNQRTTFAVGIVLICVGGPGSQNSLFHLSNLFPRRKAMVITTINSFFIMSSTIVLFLGELSWYCCMHVALC